MSSRKDPSLSVTENSSTNETLDEVIARRVSRRGIVFGGASAAFFGWLAACSDDNKNAGDGGPDGSMNGGDTGSPDTSTTDGGDAGPKVLELGFDPVAKNKNDMVTLPPGYSATVLFRLGDPMAANVPAYKNDGSESGDSFAQRAGDHHDGMYFFCMGSNGKWDQKTSDKGLLVQNHEALTPMFLHANGVTITGTGASAKRTVDDEIVKEMNAQGVSIIEVSRDGQGKWSYKVDSTFNRRITTMTPHDLTGPAAGTAFMKTKYSTDGKKIRGTVNNCANGWTPWGTYLTCEENWAGYFRRITSTDNPNRTAKELASFSRYGVTGNGRELWATGTVDTDDRFSRWNAMKLGASADGTDDYRNAPNAFGWVVEIDPFDPASTPKKRTAMGRFAHEAAWVGPVVQGKPLVFYMGDDSRDEYIYKFVTTKSWDPIDVNGGVAAGAKYLDDGKLYVAKFEADGTGKWIELAFGQNGITGAYPTYAFADQADVLINARLAADAAGGTKMDRPEWAAVNPVNGEVYFTLTNTNSSARPIMETDAANPRFYDDPKGLPDGGAPTSQKGNPNGHIIRLIEDGNNPAATTFKWDIYLFGARATASANVNLSGLTADNDFSSPDGLGFSYAHPGLLWIETDDGAFTDVTNCMLLMALPGKVGDGGMKKVSNQDGAAMKDVDTFVGKAATLDTLRRFLVGPKECEITGLAETPDGRALFVNIQHPGEDSASSFSGPPVTNIQDPKTFASHWPDGGMARPRSATIVITRNDGGPVGIK